MAVAQATILAMRMGRNKREGERERCWRKSWQVLLEMDAKEEQKVLGFLALETGFGNKG